MLALGGAAPDSAYPLDGDDLLPVIRGIKPSYERTFFWRTSEMSAALKGRWKYVNDGTKDYLFNLAVDEREQQDFREQNPAMFTQLRDQFVQWDKTVLPRPAPRRRT